MSQAQEALFHHGNMEIIDYTPSGAVVAGKLIFFGAGTRPLVGVALAPLDANRLAGIAIAGIYKVKKKAGAVFAIGDAVGWDTGLTQAVVSSDGTLDYYIGACVGTPDSDDYVYCKINEVSGYSST